MNNLVKEWVNTKEQYKYNQYTKQNVRHMALFKAVEILTSKRGQSCCVERNYVRRLYDYFTLSEDISQNKTEVQKINVSYITNWEKLHDSFVKTKRPEETTSDLSIQVAGCTRLELATSDVTGRRSNQLS